MLMPALSVTAIGVIAAVVAITRHRPPVAALVHALVGAWLGFLAGAVAGVLLDIALQTGIFVPILGHAVAAAGAILAVTRTRPVPATIDQPE
jgi:ribose/xylose/arabinose/galactoside ABC-type transport system permease subunit